MPIRSRILPTLALPLTLLAGCIDPVAPPGAVPQLVAAASACALGVTDADAITLLDALRLEIDALEAAGALIAGQANALRSHLQNVQRHVETGRYCPALAQLQAFLDQVAEFEAEGILTGAQTAALIAHATDIIEGLPAFPNQVIVDPPSSAAGAFVATGAAFGPAPDASGQAGSVVLVNDGNTGFGTPTDACEPLIGFPAGAIAMADRGVCTFVQKALNAQAAGAIALIVVQNNAGGIFQMGGADPTITIPSVMISQADGATIKAGLPATGTVRRTP